MNTETGQVYRGKEAIEQAQQRGEPIVSVSERVADMVELGGKVLNRHERRKAAALARRKSNK